MIARLALVSALSLATFASAQAPPASELGSALVEELEVVASPPGPPLWRVAKGQAEVVILGGVTPLPHALVWDTRRVERALDGARVLLLPPRPRVGLLDVASLAIGGRDRYRPETETSLETGLPEPLQARYVAARAAALKKPGAYDRWKPQIAGFMLVSDFREAAGLSNAKPGSTLAKLARARGVKVRHVGDYRLLPLAKEAAALSDAGALSCLEDAVSQVEVEALSAQDLARAWAAGDLRGVRAAYAPPALERCVQQAPSVAALIERGTAAGVAAILEALEEPGRAVAVIDLNYLLRPNGVLDRLKAAGAEVSVPLGG